MSYKLQDECPSKEDALVDSLPTNTGEALVSTVLAENESIGSPKHSRIAMRFTSIVGRALYIPIFFPGIC